MTVSGIVSLMVARCGVTIMSQSQNNNPWSGDVDSMLMQKFKTQPSVSEVMCIIFWDRKGVFLLHFLEP